jgi:choline dehydrogenase-like flavoprotein
VIGSGFGGSIPALRLTEKGYDVCVPEQAPRMNTPTPNKGINRRYQTARRYRPVVAFRRRAPPPQRYRPALFGAAERRAVGRPDTRRDSLAALSKVISCVG